MRPPLPPMPPAPKPPPTAFQLAIQAEEMTQVAQQQQTRLKKLYGARKDRSQSDEDTDSEKDERDRHSNRTLDFLA